MSNKFLLPKRKIPFKVSLLTVIITVIAILTLANGVIIWREGELAATASSETLVREISHRVAGNWKGMMAELANTALITAAAPSLATPVTASPITHPAIPLLEECLASNPELFSAFIGHSDGSFLQAILPLGDSAILTRHKAPAETDLILRAIQRSGGVESGEWLFLGPDKEILERRPIADLTYDPRTRPWYKTAHEPRKPIFTEPYRFAHSGAPGITCSIKLPGGKAVFGADITLQSFDAYLKAQHVSPNGVILLLDKFLNLLAHSNDQATVAPARNATGNLTFVNAATAEDPILQAAADWLQTPIANAMAVRRIPINGQEHLITIFTSRHQGWGLKHIVVAAPMADFTGHLVRIQRNGALVALLTFGIFIPLAIFIARRIAGPLEVMEHEARHVHQFNFADRPPLQSFIREVDALSSAFDLMKSTIRSRTEALLDTQGKLEQLVDRGIALASERNMDKLLEMIFLTAKDLTNADAGILSMLGDDGKLHPICMRIDSMDLGFDCSQEGECPLPPVPVDPTTCKDDRMAIACRAVKEQRTISIGGKDGGQVQREEEMIFTMPEFGEGAGYLIQTQMASPLVTRSGKVIGVLHLMNARDEVTWHTVPFGHRDGFVEALAAQAAVAIDNQHLLKEIEALFDAFVKLIADAIDAKSPYTGGHCSRVPVIAKMLGQAAHDAQSGPLARFHFQNDDAWREFHIAAWLHDCGKVTTPEHVMDKSLKLETIHDRMHEVATRIEVLKRDARIALLERRLRGEIDEAEERAQLARECRALDEEREFLAQCNRGAESMREEDKQRVRAIARRRWVDARGEARTLLDEEEVYNLTIDRGTLTPEERAVINHHIVATISMLESLPYPKHLARVPEFAGGHHEHVDGSGYPRGLTREQMSVQARVMAIADVFEALTAGDRPYKKAMKLSQALTILGRMCEGGKIDPDLFQVFIRERVYLRYAETFLDPEQIDEVDHAAIPGYRGEARA